MEPTERSIPDHLLRLGLHESQHAVIVLLEVCVEKRRPSSRVTAVNAMAARDELLHAADPARQGGQVQRGRAALPPAVDICPVLQEERESFAITPLCGQHERGEGCKEGRREGGKSRE